MLGGGVGYRAGVEKTESAACEKVFERGLTLVAASTMGICIGHHGVCESNLGIVDDWTPESMLHARSHVFM